MVVSVQTAAPAASEKVFFDGKNDLYEGHKVVAMPNSAFGGMSVRDVVSSRNIDYRNSTPNRRRSGSIGRSPASRSRDIVQDVYNRIGVNYIRGRPSIENLLEDTNAAVASQGSAQDGTRPPSRGRSLTRGNEGHDSGGRSDQLSSDVDRRPRSQSRNRVVSRWPPEPSSIPASSGTSNTSKFSHSPSTEFPPLGASPQMMGSKDRPNYGNQRRSTPQPLNPAFVPRPMQTDKKKRQSFPDARDEHVDEDNSNVEEKRDGVSVKDRINAYGPTSKNVPNSRVIRRSYNNQFNKRDRPPKVDIYADSNGNSECHGERDGVASAGDSAEASDNVGQNSTGGDHRKRFSSANSVSHRSVRSGIADAFLAAISPNKTPSSPVVSKNIPIVEIPNDDLNAGADSASLAASSVSGEDFGVSPKKRHCKSFGSQYKPYGFGNGGVGMSGEKIEKYIEERVQAEVAAMASTLEARFEHEYKSRIEDLERQMEKLHSMLSKRM